MTGEVDAANDAPVVEVTFTLDGSSYPFVAVSAEEGCTFTLAEMVRRGEERYAEFFEVDGAAPADVVTLADERATVEVSVLSSRPDGGLFEFLVSGDCPAYALAERGALPRRVESEAGTGRIVAEIPGRYDPTAIVDGFLDGHADADLVAVREKETVESLFSGSAFERAVREHLTDRQREVVRVAFEAGYYDWPRRTTGEAVADSLGISSATFSEHIHAAERKLLALAFEQST